MEEGGNEDNSSDFESRDHLREGMEVISFLKKKY